MKPGQILTRVLIGGCGLMVVLGALLLGGFGQSAEPRDFESQSLGDEDDALAALGQFRLAALDQYAEIPGRPLFNDDRRPKEVEGGPQLEDGNPEDLPPVSLNVTVNGIIITDDVKVALVRDNATKEVHRLREGMPMEGDQGAWVLTSIEPRELVFEGGGSEPARVELKVYKKALKGGAPAPRVAISRPGQSAQSEATNQQAMARNSGQSDGKDAQTESGFTPPQTDDERAAKAEEIRQRVAERRAQLRAEAARRRAEQNKEKE